MPKSLISFFFYFFLVLLGYSQSTDLAISVEAQDLSGNDISQAHIYEEFQYLVTITNTGDAVSNAIFSQIFNTNTDLVSFISQNPIGGTSLITDFNYSNDELTGTITDFPASSSIEVKVVVRAPPSIGGIATTANILPPDGVNDTNLSNNISIISIDITDILIDFTVVQEQITPPAGTPISAWGDTITYHFTITNNSNIVFPIEGFEARLALNTSRSFGTTSVVFVSAQCISATNGTNCIEDISIPTDIIPINSVTQELMLEITNEHEFTSNGSVTLELIYQYLEPECALEIGEIEALSIGEIAIEQDNESSNLANEIISPLLTSTLCLDTDVCIESIQTDPAVSVQVNWNEEVTFETTICNNGPLDADVLASFRNTSDFVEWQIVSIECVQENSTVSCSTVNFANAGSYWVSSFFNMPVDQIVTVRTVVVFLEPDCVIDPPSVTTNIRSDVSIVSSGISDSFLTNNSDSDFVNLNNPERCDTIDLEVTKTQISPALPEGSDASNTAAWGPVTYEVTATNLSPDDTFFELTDFMTLTTEPTITAVMQSVNCVSTTGSASCNEVQHNAIGIELDGISDDDDELTPDIFWEILPEDNWVLPGNSSITFEVVIDWIPLCETEAIPATNNVMIQPDEAYIDSNDGNNNDFVTTFFAPCVDLIVQTFPEFSSVIVNQPFNWIVDITNSSFSSNAIDVRFEDVLDNSFVINGTPTCQVTSGNATCISNFIVNGNVISATVPNMEAGSTVRILIPVLAPSNGGAFVNYSEGIPSPVNNEELTPETNISISSVQVLAPTLEKVFDPDLIYTNETSTLSFTIYNPNVNTAESNIDFIDNLPNGLTLASEPQWISSNGSTANFSGTIGDTFIEVRNLNIPIGVFSCTFSVDVTSNSLDFYINNHTNFTDQNNIDTTLVYADLEVIENPNSEDDCLNIPEVFTPNNDLVNDYFEIPCLEDYSNPILKIYNRYGVLIFEQINYDNSWDGTPNTGLLNSSNKRVPIGTYYYILEINNEKPLMGWVYLNY